MTLDAGSLIRSARLDAGLSQPELARRAGVTQPVISVYENGHREPGLAMLSKLLGAAGHEFEITVRPRPEVRSGLPDTPIGRRLRRRRQAILETCSRRGASNVRVFGSVARGDDSASSDIDLLVDLDEQTGLLDLIGLERELRTLLGREVDIVPSATKPGVEAQVAADAIPL